MSIDRSGADNDLLLEPTKPKWNQQANRFTQKSQAVRDGPSKDHAKALKYLQNKRNALWGSQDRRVSEGGYR